MAAACLAMGAVTSSQEEAWKEDLHFLAKEMERVHPNLFHAVSREQFHSAVTELDGRIPSLTRDDIIVGIAKLVALIGEGHTQMGLSSNGDPKIGFGRYPLSLYLYADGLFVRAASPELTRLVGGRVLRIGRMSVSEAIEAVRPIIHRENEMTFKDVLPSRLVIPEVLHSLGVCEEREACAYEIESVTGRRLTVRLDALPFGKEPAWVRANDASRTPLPLYLQHRDKNFWFEYLPRQHSIYVQYNVVFNSDDETVEHFFGRVFDFIADHPVDRMILDLRLNNGGDNTLNAPLVSLLRNCKKVNRRGHLFVIIGRLTFSAGMNCAMDLEKNTEAIFVGEPTESSPNQYGDATRIVLPHSGIGVSVSTRYWEDGGPSDHRPWLAPQIPAVLTSKDYRDNRDPAMNAIAAFREKTPRP